MYNIKDFIIHAALYVPANKRFKYKKMSNDILHIYRTKYRNLKLIFIH